MKVLYISNYFLSFVHYPIIKMAEDNDLDYYAFFLQNRYTFHCDPESPKQWTTKNLSHSIEKNKYKIISYPGLPKNILMHFYWKYCYWKIKKILNEKYDIIHAHCLYPAGMIAYKLSKELDIPFVVTTHGADFYNSIPINGKTRYSKPVINHVRTVLENAKAILAVSDIFANDIIEFCPSAKTVVNENTYNSKIFFDQQLQKDEKKLNFLTVGYFIPRKNHLKILQAFNDCLEINKNIHLTIIGNGILHRDYLDYIHKNNLQDDVTIKGFMPQHQLVNEYNKADVFILASQNEPFGIVILEAFACGLPVIASDTQGPLGVIADGFDGYIYDKESVCALKEKMQIFINNPHKIKQMKPNGLEKAKHYSEKHNEVYALYQNILEK